MPNLAEVALELDAAHRKAKVAFSRKDQWHVMQRLGEGRLIYADKLA